MPILNPDTIPVLLCIFSAIHVCEEYVYPGGFAKKFKAMLLKKGLVVSNSWLIVTNVMFLGLVAACLFVSSWFFIVSAVSVVLINALLHIGKSIHARAYFPGLVTAVLLYLPLSFFAYFSIPISTSGKALALTCGFFLHLFPFILLITIFNSRK